MANETEVAAAPPRKGSLWKKLLLALVIIVGVFLAYVAWLPADYRVERSTTINAPVETVFAQVNDFHNWDAWSPWTKLDPHAKKSFEGSAVGEGAVFKWSGNDEIGEGSMTLTESQPLEWIQIKLHFVRPFENSADVEFKFSSQGDQTSVSWVMSGKNDFMGKIICLFMNMDRMIGGDFEKGLASLKSASESPPQS